MPRAAIAVLVVALAASAGAHEEPHDAELPDEEPRLYEPPPVGSYELPPIDRVAEHLMLGPDGAPEPVPGIAPGQAALVSFVYTHCADAGGCPAALALLRRIDRSLAERPELADRVRLVSASFDPARDTPERMAELRDLMMPRSDWRFVTAADAAAVAPVLHDYGQDLLRYALPGDGEPRVMRHVLKVFLLDGDRAIRNVYSAGFLDWRVVLNDLATVLGQEAP